MTDRPAQELQAKLDKARSDLTTIRHTTVARLCQERDQANTARKAAEDEVSYLRGNLRWLWKKLHAEEQTFRNYMTGTAGHLFKEVDRVREESREAIERLRDAADLLMITHFDSERLITDENFGRTDLFEKGLLKHVEVGQTGEKQVVLTEEGENFIRSTVLGDDYAR